MGFSLVAEALLPAHLQHASWTRLISKFGYSAGFLIVILERKQLSTETTLTVIIPLLSWQTFRKIKGVLRTWAVILAANLIGAQVVAGNTSTPHLIEYGGRRIGEIDLTDSASAVASAVYHAPGVARAC